MSTVIDPATFIAPGAVVLGDVQIGADSSVWYYTVIRGDTERIRIGEGTNLQDFTMVHADPGVPCLVGHRVTVGHRVILHGCVVEDECLIGMGAILLNRVKVGTGSVVGAGVSCSKGWKSHPGRSWSDRRPKWFARSMKKPGRGSTGSGGTTSSRRSAIDPGSLPSSPPAPRPADSSQRASRSVGKRLHRSST